MGEKAVFVRSHGSFGVGVGLRVRAFLLKGMKKTDLGLIKGEICWESWGIVDCR